MSQPDLPEIDDFGRSVDEKSEDSTAIIAARIELLEHNRSRGLWTPLDRIHAMPPTARLEFVCADVIYDFVRTAKGLSRAANAFEVQSVSTSRRHPTRLAVEQVVRFRGTSPWPNAEHYERDQLIQGGYPCVNLAVGVSERGYYVSSDENYGLEMLEHVSIELPDDTSEQLF
jgi:hypothetical protein